MKINKTTGWAVGTAGLCVAITAGSWFGLVEPQRAAAAESRGLTVTAESENQQLAAQIEQLEMEYANLPARQAELAAIRLALPDQPALAQLVRDVSARSEEAGTVLDSLNTGAPVAVVDPGALAAVAAPAPEPSAAPSAEPSAAPSAAPSAPGTDPSAVGAAPAVPVQTQPVLAAVPVTITTTGSFSTATLLLKEVQADMPRALLVDSVALTLVDDAELPPGTVQSVITGRVFVYVDPTAVTTTTVPLVTPSTAPSDG